MASAEEDYALTTILEEIRDFRREFQDFKSDLVRVNNKITEAETRIAKMEDRVQNVEQMMLKIISEQENKIVDQESQERIEGAEGSSMPAFLGKILKECLDLPQGIELGIERSHRALGAARNRY